MIECVKCGHRNEETAQACGDCRWPFTVAAWSNTTYKIRRMTFDTCCVNAESKHTDLNTLERWGKEGHIHIQRAKAMLTDLTNDKGVKAEKRRAKALMMSDHPEVARFDISC